MPKAPMQACTSVYQSVLEPWTRLASGAPDVINMRLSAMPWLWLLDPLQALTETQRMFTEKHEAWNETIFAIYQTPLQLWFDTVSASWSQAPQTALNNALINSSRRVARPSNRRVRANQERLSG